MARAFLGPLYGLRAAPGCFMGGADGGGREGAGEGGTESDVRASWGILAATRQIQPDRRGLAQGDFQKDDGLIFCFY